jgi:hypothetical protein
VGAFLNTATGAYPRYAADVLADPDAPWVIVEDTPRPLVIAGQVAVEDIPLPDESGTYRQTWQVVAASEPRSSARDVRRG